MDSLYKSRSFSSNLSNFIVVPLILLFSISTACLKSVLILSSFCYISDPFCWLVATLLVNSQKSDSQTGCCEHRYLFIQYNRLEGFSLMRSSTWNSIEIGGFAQGLSFVVAESSISHLRRVSSSPGNFLILRFIFR